MIKDILVSLPVSASSSAVLDYAVSVATTFEAHLAGVAFAYEPVVPGTVFDGVAASIIETYRAESEKAGQAAVAKFNEATRRAGISAEAHLLEAGPSGAGEMFAQFARHFDLSIVGQAEPEKDMPEELLPEAALFGSGMFVSRLSSASAMARSISASTSDSTPASRSRAMPRETRCSS